MGHRFVVLAACGALLGNRRHHVAHLGFGYPLLFTLATIHSRTQSGLLRKGWRPNMKLVLLGTTGYFPNERRHTLCLALPQCGVVLDAGTGLFRLARYTTTDELDIFLSHAHLDHIVGLTYLHGVLADKTLQRVTVHAAQEKIDAIRKHLFAEAIFPVAPRCDFRPLKESVAIGGGGTVRHFPLQHPGGSIGFRLDWPQRSMAYVTDTTAAVDAPYVKLLQGVDLLVHECYFPDNQAAWAEKTGHSHTTPVAQVAKACGAKRLILVHMDPASTDDDPIDLQTARAIFPNTELGEDLAEIEF